MSYVSLHLMSLLYSISLCPLSIKVFFDVRLLFRRRWGSHCAGGLPGNRQLPSTHGPVRTSTISFYGFRLLPFQASTFHSGQDATVLPVPGSA